jgi:drug/metabolite transporter (DMT)-like permease
MLRNFKCCWGKILTCLLSRYCPAWISLGYITQAVALASIPSGKCAFICSLTVVIVPLFSALFYGKAVKPLNVVSAAIALSGVAILEGLVDTSSIVHLFDGGAVAAETATTAITTSASATNTNILEQFTSGNLGLGKADLIALGQPFGFGIAFLRIEHYVEKFKEEKNQVLTLSAAQCLSVGVISLAWVLYDFHGTIPDMHYMVRFFVSEG